MIGYSMRDLTKDYDYERLIREEVEHYSEVEVTERLMLGGAHAHSSWDYYWQRVYETLLTSRYSDIARVLKEDHEGEAPIRILSLASGYCGHELELAERLGTNYEITCTDVNPGIFARAKEVAKENALHLRFETVDLNFIKIAPETYDMIMAYASLHHVINLEHLMDQISGGLKQHGFFHLVEVIGQNRKHMWDENEVFVNSLLRLLPESLVQTIVVQPSSEQDGMEGIRQEEILPLLRQRFETLYEYLHGAFMRFICTHDDLGSALDPQDPFARRYLDFLIDVDVSAVKQGILRPLEIWGTYRPIAPGDRGRGE